MKLILFITAFTFLGMPAFASQKSCYKAGYNDGYYCKNYKPYYWGCDTKKELIAYYYGFKNGDKQGYWDYGPCRAEDNTPNVERTNKVNYEFDDEDVAE